MNLIQCNSIIAVPPAGGAPSFPATPILDDFNRSDENPLDNGNWSSGWQGSFSGVMKLESNKIVGHTFGAEMASATWNTSFNADQEAYFTIDTRVGGSYHALHCRSLNAGTGSVTGYRALARTDNDDIVVTRFDSESTGANIAFISQALADGDKMGMRVVGTSGEIWYKQGAGAWTMIGTFDASAYNNAGKIACSLGQNAGSLADDFGGGNV